MSRPRFPVIGADLCELSVDKVNGEKIWLYCLICSKVIGEDVCYLNEAVRVWIDHAEEMSAKHWETRCSDCERCTWNPGRDCGKTEHPHCPKCRHCQYRHVQTLEMKP